MTTTGSGARFTMEDVAALAGVSRASVSRVFLGQGKVSDDTRAKVRQAAARLGYVPNVMASRLASGETSGTIGLLLRDASNPAYGLLFTELQHAAQDAGLRLISMTISADTQGERQVAALDTLLGLQVGGLIVATGGVSSAQLEPFRTRLPIIRAGRPETTALLHAVSYDEAAGARDLADLVADHGHRSVAVLSTPEDHSFPEWIRSSAHVQRLRERGIEVARIPVRDPDDGVGEALELARAGAITAALCPSDLRALELLRAARAAGMDVPRELSVTGCDGIVPGLDLIGLTTLRLDVPTLARRTVARLADLMAGHTGDTVRELIPGTLIPGRTVAPVSPLKGAS